MLDRNPFANTLANPANEEASDGGDFLRMSDIFRFLRRYFLTIAVATVIGAGVAGYIAWTATPVFTARAQVLIDPRISQIQREQVGEAVVPLDTAQMESQLALLRSEGIAKTVIATLDLTKDPDFQFKPKSSWLPFRSAPPQASDADKLREAVLIFQESLDVSRVGISYGIDIAFGAKDPEKAARISNTTAILYVRDQLETRRLAAQAGSLWLEDKINVLRQKMNSAARTAQEFKASRDYRLVPQQDRREAQSNDRITDLAHNAREFGITLEELESTAQTYRKLYESYLLAYTEALQRDSYPVSNARVISTALPPLTKSHPKTQLILALGTFIGLLAGIGIALIRNTTA
ncbi:MAG: GumC family protein [Rhodospirillales bacterium]|nr:GumC family protein [Rhodospirillales bacterium]